MEKKMRWGLSRRGWICLLLILPVFFVLWLIEVFPFFAVTEPVTANLLVVEGWVPEYAIRAAATEFVTGGYRKVISTGGPVQGMGGYVNDYSTAASIGATRLKALDLPANAVEMVPSRVLLRDRTYASAMALRSWLTENYPMEKNVNVVTTDVHARRTRLLFQLALGRNFSVGIIAVPNPDYNPARWWRYSEGVRDVLGEMIAYIYAKFFFHP